MLYTNYEKTGLLRVLEFLKAHQYEYLSGEDLSEILKISRVAVWKYIKKIQALGYKIDSKKNLGYRLTKTTDLMLPWEVSEGLKTKQIGKKIYYFESIDSTQNYANSICNNIGENGSVIIAQTQKTGKGRHGRSWISPSGGIWMSLVVKPNFDVSMLTLVPFAAAVSLHKAISQLLGIKTQLKWPNDVLVGKKKVAGIIIDATVESSQILSFVLGVGINFKVNPKEIQKQISNSKHFFGAATLVNKKNTVKPAKLVQAFIEEFENKLSLLENQNSEHIIKEWTKHSSTIGRQVKILRQNSTIHGRAVRLGDDGSLVIKQGSKLLKITSGDVFYL